jgi:DNA-directed RNA polymerase specialized sigma24 family protein
VTNEFHRRLHTAKYDIKREISLDQQAGVAGSVRSSDPTPSQEAVANERLETLLRGRPELHQRILRLRTQGFTFAEIAAQTGIDESSARKFLRRVESELGVRHAGQ